MDTARYIICWNAWEIAANSAMPCVVNIKLSHLLDFSNKSTSTVDRCHASLRHRSPLLQKFHLGNRVKLWPLVQYAALIYNRKMAPPPPLGEVFFCPKILTLEPDVGLKFFKKVKWSELKIRNFWPGSRHLRPFPDRPDPISSLTELLSTHHRNRFLSNPHSFLNRARRAQRHLLYFCLSSTCTNEFLCQ